MITSLWPCDGINSG